MEKIGELAPSDPYDKSFIQPSTDKGKPGEYCKQVKEEESLLVSNGCVDFRGRIAVKKTTGGWKASPFIIVNEVAERLAFFAVAVNMVTYLVLEMRQSLPDAATHVTDWIGAAYVLTILGAFLADSYLGRFRTIIIFSCVYTVGMVLLTLSASIDSLPSGIPYYRYQKPMGSPFTRFVQVMVLSMRNHFGGVEVGREDELYEVRTLESDIVGARKLTHTPQFRFLDKAAVITDPEDNNLRKNRWKLCTVTQVEEFKSFIRVLPVWASTIALSISFAQLSTFFISQAIIMDRKLGSGFEIPAGSVPVFSAINALILIPIYEKLMVPIIRKRTGHHRGITSLQRMGVGLFISIFAMASAALVEKKRRDHSKLNSTSRTRSVKPIFSGDDSAG
ncbi:hypothetical protein FEM48_Zijuj06G0088500 [Ziziphus jujuba var. spinosa]|uniref:Uncharacterized protein n=1 Tax=Ziziphus jujuba var. spinosa TaxID=714518 RepID=A0A978V8B4_ZIZJJ|nr:hypothetical protein FEM48_Zijuj06G0088500 [Ziziphus jujuba var. spinosa]